MTLTGQHVPGVAGPGPQAGPPSVSDGGWAFLEGPHPRATGHFRSELVAGRAAFHVNCLFCHETCIPASR